MAAPLAARGLAPWNAQHQAPQPSTHSLPPLRWPPPRWPNLQALCPGVRRCFKLDMPAGGRRDGRLVRAEPAVEASAQAAMVFVSKHPRFYPAP